MRGLGNLRIAFLRLWRKPAFALTAVALLGLGLGLEVAMFSVLESILLRPLPYPEGDRLVFLTAPVTGAPHADDRVAPLDFFDWKGQAHSFEGMAAWMFYTPTLVGVEEPRSLTGSGVTPDFFTVLGVRPLLGRDFHQEEGVLGRNNVAILSHGLWWRSFGGERGIVGRILSLDGEPHTVVGVAPPGLEYPYRNVDIWLPLAFDLEHIGRSRSQLNVVARLAPGSDAAGAQQEMNTVAEGLEARFPATNQGRLARVTPARETMVRSLRPVLWALLAACTSVLLIACGNVTFLWLVRAESRRQELALHRALGADSRSLLGQAVVEGQMLAWVSLALAYPLALGLVGVLRGVGPAQIPRFEQLSVSSAALGFMILAAVLTGLLCSLPAALRSVHGAPAAALNRGGAPRRLGGLRTRPLLVIGEVALTLALLVTGGLLLRSLAALEGTPRGFKERNLLALYLSLPSARYPAANDRVTFYADLLKRLEAVSGIRSAAAIQGLPLSGGEGDFDLAFTIEGDPPRAGAPPSRASGRIVTPGYFSTMGIPILRGRPFNLHDRGEAPMVVVVNEAWVKRYLGGKPAVEVRLKIDSWGGRDCWIVGVVGDTVEEDLRRRPKPLLYWPHHQMPTPSMAVVLRTEGPPEDRRKIVRSTLYDLDPEQPIYRLITMRQLVVRSLEETRFQLALLAIFGLLAIVLAMTGIFAVLAEVVAGRRREFGVRMALGADSATIRRSVLGRMLRWIGAGIALGLLLAIWAGRWLESLLFQVSPIDPLVLAGGAMLAFLVALSGSLLPVLRAGRTPPAKVLREM